MQASYQILSGLMSMPSAGPTANLSTRVDNLARTVTDTEDVRKIVEI